MIEPVEEVEPVGSTGEGLARGRADAELAAGLAKRYPGERDRRPLGFKRVDPFIRARVIATCSATLAALGCGLAVLAASATAATCPNAKLRTGLSARLRDCRAYELVSPTKKNGYDITFRNEAVAPKGNSVTYDSLGSFAGNPAGAILDQYLSKRTAKGWSTRGISPRESSDASNLNDFYVAFSESLSRMVVQNGDPPLDRATRGTLNLYVREPGGSLRLLTLGEPRRQPFGGASFGAASSDFSHVLFEDADRLVKGASSNGQLNLYEWVDGVVRLVGANGALAGSNSGDQTGSAQRAMSPDGSRFYWTSGTAVINLEQAGVKTAITASQCTSKPSCAKGKGSGDYWMASVDDSKAFFTSNERLTNRSTATSAGYGDLYEYDATTHKLADLTVDSSSQGTAVQGVIGSSKDGSYVYYVANGVLAPGAAPGKCSLSAGPSAKCNLYAWHDGKTSFVATVSEADSGDWAFVPAYQVSTFAQLSPDGVHLLFTSSASPASGYDNAGHSEVYLYSAKRGTVKCVSCRPSGAAATGDAALARLPEDAAAAVTALQDALNNMGTGGKRVFFESADALVPQDTNRPVDVYEWEADGTGTCRSSRGCVYLISSGKSRAPSYFEDADRSGRNVFFLTLGRLVGRDKDSNYDLYDARVDGGFASPSRSSGR
ncbi:MAG: hypothetical protein JO240_18795 [Solirubrobacterales bacterium]|nr:hypothetical protein [Solirubrobacterales bacterium]